ncbi:MAG TPA: NAD-dependent epimerase/dehydratase family protein [Rhodanobacteraceae bacterium]|nr:NAD-dependent epimerase/dehydratase family protein [Rhodanobacteraceae bacterium]
MPVSVVFGASGAVGRFLLPRLIDAGHDVVAVSRESRESAHPHVRWIVGALPAPVPALPAGDAIFSLGPLDGFVEWYAESTGRARVVALGSQSAVTKDASTDPRERNVAARLVDAEARLANAAAARGAEATVLRATLIYGAGLDRSLTPIARFARRWHVFPSVAGATGLRQPVHADDLASACLRLAAMRQLPQSVYAAGGGERLAFSTMLARVRDSLPVATLPLPVPLAFARAAGGIARALPAFRAMSLAALDRLREDLVADNAPAAADFGWTPRDFRPGAGTWTPPPIA